MKVDFATPTYWRDFYESYLGEELGKPNDAGWVNFTCPLRTHPGADASLHGGVDLNTGRFKCWNSSCNSRTQNLLGRIDSTYQTISAAEFLILTQSIDRPEADRIVESFRLSQLSNGTSPESVHHDTFSKVYRPNRAWESFVEESRKALTPDLLIVQEYCSSRGLRFETLQKAGMGYVPADPSIGQLEALVHIYVQNGVIVGIRARGFDGSKGGVSGSYATLYQLQTTIDSKSRTCILCEGETDTLITRQLLDDAGYGDIPVLGIPGSSYDISWNRHLQQFSRVIFLGQTDNASRLLAMQVQRALVEKVELVTPPFAPQATGKDVADYLQLEPGNRTALLDQLGISRDDVSPLPYVLDIDDLFQLASQPIPWLIPELIERGTKTLVVGPPKTQKTWLALELAVSVLVATPFLTVERWQPEQPGRVLIVEEEGSPNRFGQRLVKLLEGNRVDGLSVVHRQGVKVDNEESFARLRHEVLRIRPDLVIFDPYASIHLGDENVVKDTMEVIDAFNVILRALPRTALVIIHHSPKDGDGARGSSALWGAVDTQIGVQRTEVGIKLSIRGRDLPDDRGPSEEFFFDPTTGRHRPVAPIILANGGTKPKIRELASKIASYLRSHPGWCSREDVQVEVNVSDYLVFSALDELVKRGLAESIGSGRRNDPKSYRWIGNDDDNAN